MFNIIDYDEGLPISVVVPLSKKRKDFFYSYTLPLIESNEPMQIIINDDIGSAPKKRNEGFKKITQPYVLFLDDDCLIPSNFLETLYNRLKTTKDNIGYTYTSYDGIVLHPESHPMRGNFSINSFNFSSEILKQRNYISTMSLIKSNIFPGFDETLKRFQDWDIYLNLYINKNISGIFVPNLRFLAFYLDSGITSRDNNEQEAYSVIKKKYSI